MDLQGYKLVILINSFFITEAVSSLYSKAYNGYTLIMPLTTIGGKQSPYPLRASDVEQWCSTNGGTSPRINDKIDQNEIVDFIRNAVQNNELAPIQRIFLNNIHHTIENWTWVNGQESEDFAIRMASTTSGTFGYFFGYLWTNDYQIASSRPTEGRRYICESTAHSNSSSQCGLKLGKRCYWKNDNKLTWYKAREACLNEGGDLTSFEQLDHKNLKVSLRDLRLNDSTSYWIGISKSVWRWNDNGTDSVIKYSNWKTYHPSSYNATCLCLNKSPNGYKWAGCECNNEYPFICKRNDTSNSYAAISTTIVQNVDIAGTAVQISPLPLDQLSDTSMLSETVKSALLFSFGALVVVIIILVVATIIIRKKRNRQVNSCRHTTSKATTEFPIYDEIQDPIEFQPASAVYSTVQTASMTSKKTPANNVVYAELDLLPKA